MPTVFRVALPVDNLTEAMRFYGALFAMDPERPAPDLCVFRFAGAALACRESMVRDVAPHAEPVYIAVEEPLTQVHYRAQSIGARHVDRELRTLDTGEHGFLLHDPFGNALYLADQRSVAWRPTVASNGRTGDVPAAEATVLALQRDFINAVKGGDLATVQELLGLDPELIEVTDASGVSALLHAAYKGHRAVAQFLLERNPDLNLWEAAAFGKDDRLAALLDRGFKVNVYSPDGFTPLGLACFFGHVDCAKRLLARGANPDAASQNTMAVRPLHSAVARADADAVLANVRALIAAGADVNARQQGGYTPLHQAADRGLVAVAKLLLSAGAKPDAASDNGRTPRDLARARGHAELLELLP